jgi:hypothetical protein
MCPDQGITVVFERHGIRPVRRFDARRLVGLRLPAASRLARAHRCSVSVSARDGKPVTQIFNLVLRRINVEVDHDVVTAIAGVG